MKNSFLLGLFVSIMLPLLALVQANQTIGPSINTAQRHPPAKEVKITSFHVQEEGQGPLRIVYSDGTEVKIPKERGRSAINDQILAQETFSDVQMADDCQHIGWLAHYMICAQSYSCPAELVIYQYGSPAKYISPPYGIVSRWMFLEGGRKVVVEFGFPHGDQSPIYTLHDTETGRELSRFLSKEQEKGPDWVEQLRGTKTR